MWLKCQIHLGKVKQLLNDWKVLRGSACSEEKTYSVPLAYEDLSSSLFQMKSCAKGTLHVSVRGAHFGIVRSLCIVSVHACLV